MEENSSARRENLAEKYGSTNSVPTRTGRAAAKKYRKKEEKKNRAGWIICIIIAVATALFIRSFIAEPIRVEGRSMNPTFYSDETLLVEKVSRYFELPERGDVVIVHYGDDATNYVKRVIGLPGETIEIKDSTVYIDGVALIENYTSDEPYPDMKPVTVPEDSVFVMGDNRANSQDSRYVGSIPHDNIVGKAVCVIWPIDQWEQIENPS